MLDQATAQVNEYIFRTTSDGIIITDEAGVVQRINPAAAAMLAVTVDEVRDKLASECLYSDPGIKLLFTRDAEYTAQVRLPHRRFGLGICMITADKHRLVVIQDITEKRELDSRRESLSHTIAHDLRNPLSAISGFAELVAKFGELTPQQQKFLTRIRQTSSKIHDMAKPLVDLAWIEAGMPLAHRPVQMSEIIDHAVRELSFIAQANKVTIATSVQNPMPMVMGDPERLKIVIYNLLHNAVIYSQEEQPVVIHAWSDEQEVFCSVADRGIGIANDELDLVFDRMYRSRDERVREMAGGGLGLTVAKTIIGRHGGDIWAASTLGEGSTFTFVMPTAQKQ
jgi:two-component system, OmpR family, sensor histidine kinase ResE